MFADMPNGLASMTVDIFDIENRPFYHNTRIVCSTCNTEKRQASPDEWGEIQYCHRLWEERKKMNDAEFYKGTLLEGIEPIDEEAA